MYEFEADFTVSGVTGPSWNCLLVRVWIQFRISYKIRGMNSFEHDATLCEKQQVNVLNLYGVFHITLPYTVLRK